MSKLASNKDYLWPSAQLLRAGVRVLVQIGLQAGVGEQCATAEEGRALQMSPLVQGIPLPCPHPPDQPLSLTANVSD